MENFDDELFLDYKKHIETNSSYAPDIFPKAPQNDLKFPTIIMKEISNYENTDYKTTERSENANNKSYGIEIYTKDLIKGKTLTTSKKVQNELKNLTFDYFYKLGFNRTTCEPAEYLDVTVDRLVIIERCLTNSWNNHISY